VGKLQNLVWVIQETKIRLVLEADNIALHVCSNFFLCWSWICVSIPYGTGQTSEGNWNWTWHTTSGASRSSHVQQLSVVWVRYEPARQSSGPFPPCLFSFFMTSAWMPAEWSSPLGRSARKLPRENELSYFQIGTSSSDRNVRHLWDFFLIIKECWEPKGSCCNELSSYYWTLWVSVTHILKTSNLCERTCPNPFFES
jgi:hypothetical protein